MVGSIADGRTEKVPFNLFTTKAMPARQQFGAWRDSVGVVFDVTPRDSAKSAGGFAAMVRAWHFGNQVVSAIDFDAQSFVRDRRRAAADGLDHYLVQLYATGGLVGEAEGRERVLRPGDLQILDLSRANRTRAERSRTVSVIMPRASLQHALSGPADLHGLVLRGTGGAGLLLADYLRSLSARAASVSRRDASSVARATAQIVAACFQSTADTMAQAQGAIETTLLERAQKHIAANLRSPRLSPPQLATDLRLSRSQLYRLFERLGGVASYIQTQRLLAARDELADPAHDRRRIFEIAYDLGFASEAHFSRAFRRAFDMSPSDLRLSRGADADAVDVVAAAPGNDGYEGWVRHLRMASA